MTTEKTRSEKQVEALKKAHFIAAENLKYGSPRERGIERENTAITWIYKWDWSTPTLIEMVVDSFRSGLAIRLEKNGLIHKIASPTGGVNNTPSFFLKLTNDGLARALQITNKLLPYDTNPHKINLKKVVHDCLIQRITAHNLLANNDEFFISDYRTPKDMYQTNSNNTKIPDALWIRDYNDGTSEIFAIELELTPKFKHEFDRFVTMTADLFDMKKEGTKNGLIAGVKIFGQSPALIENYTKAFQPGVETPLWEKEPGKTGRWKKIMHKGKPTFHTMTDEMSQKVTLECITDQMLQHQAAMRKVTLPREVITIRRDDF